MNRAWAAAVLGLWLRPVFGATFLEFGVEGRLPFLRQHFELTNPRQPVHDVPTLTYGVAMGAGIQL